MAQLLAIVSKAVFEGAARAAGRVLGPGEIWPTDRYTSGSKALAPLAEPGSRLFLVTVRPPDERLWLVAVLEDLAWQDGAWVARAANRRPIRDVTDRKGDLRFESGKGITAAPGALGMSLQTPRALAAADVALLLGDAAPAAPPPPPKTEREQLLDAIFDHLDDDAPRLAWADHLSQHGDPRGALIRAQCRLRQRLSPGERESLRHEEAALLRAHGKEWEQPARAVASSWQWRRGFIDEIATTPRALFAGDAAALFAREAVSRLDLGEVRNGREVAQLASSPWLGRLAALRLRGKLGADGVKALAAAPGLARVRTLNLGECGLGAPPLAALMKSPHLAATSLCLTANELGDEGLDALAGAPRLAKVEHLYLARTGVTSEGVAALAASPHAARLTRLCLGGNEEIGDEGIEALATSPHLAALTHLELDGTGLGEPGVRALIKSPHLRALRRLVVTKNFLPGKLGDALRGRFGAFVQTW